MEWLYSLFIEHSALQAVVVLSLISAIGLGLGRVHFWGISLGVTFVFFAGILAGHLGLSVDPQMLNYAESFGLVIFVYSLGLQVGPGFFSSFRKGGVTLNMLALGVVLLGTLLTVVASYATGVSLPDMVGILCGATTNTPALGAAQQTLKQMGINSSTPALGCAVAYPMGVVGVILAVLLIRKVLVRKEDLEIKEKDDANKTYIAAFQVHNPAIFNKSIKDIARMSYPKFVISRLWRDGHVSIPTSDKILKEGDRLLVITAEKDALALTVLFGEQENTDWNKEDIDWNAIDSELISQRIVVTRPELNGKKLGALRLRNHYGINISRVYRSGVQLLATPGLILQLGDRLTVVGEAAAIQNVEKVLGNAVKSLKEPNLVVIFIGIVLGLALGAIPFSFPGVSTPVKLGLAGGQLVHAQTGGVVPENGPVAGQGLLLPPGALSPRPAVLRPPGDIQITAVQIALQGLQQLGGQQLGCVLIAHGAPPNSMESFGMSKGYQRVGYGAEAFAQAPRTESRFIRSDTPFQVTKNARGEPARQRRGHLPASGKSPIRTGAHGAVRTAVLRFGQHKQRGLRPSPGCAAKRRIAYTDIHTPDRKSVV